MRIVFMGTPDFAATALQALAAAGHEIVCVYSQPPRPAGRGYGVKPSPVHTRAEIMGLLVRTPVSLKSAEEQEAFAALKADAAVVVAYGLLLPKPVLAAPRFGCFNIHASLLPRWRGAAPIQRAIMAGDTETGVTIMRMDAGLDTGPMLLVGKTPISATTTAGELHDRLAALGAKLIVKTLETPDAPGTPQPETGATYARKIEKAEAMIDFGWPAETVRNHIHGLSPFPGAWTMIGKARVKVLKAEVADGAAVPGTAIDDHLSIACSSGAVRFLEVQREGKSAMTADALLRGLSVPAGMRLG
ncbi:methionyl-tRNA formyltransferase [Aestuariivirga sp.]|uniref:methionyl-tRNA formyltransferase n=1 Tax=Aestuariivirga sp. TaxID=2650926 RepID=UPI0039E381AE